MPASFADTRVGGQPRAVRKSGGSPNRPRGERPLSFAIIDPHAGRGHADAKTHDSFNNATPGTSQFQSAGNDLAQAESSTAHDQVLREADLRASIYNLLTSGQRTKLASLVKQRHQEMQQRAAAPAASH